MLQLPHGRERIAAAVGCSPLLPHGCECGPPRCFFDSATRTQARVGCCPMDAKAGRHHRHIGALATTRANFDQVYFTLTPNIKPPVRCILILYIFLQEHASRGAAKEIWFHETPWTGMLHVQFSVRSFSVLILM